MADQRYSSDGEEPPLEGMRALAPAVPVERLRRVEGMVRDLPDELRPELTVLLATSVWQHNAEFLAQQDLVPICAGERGEEHCRVRTAELGANRFLYTLSDPNEMRVLDQEIGAAGSVFGSLADYHQGEAEMLERASHALVGREFGPECEDVQTVREAIALQVAAREHAGHRVGVRTSARAGYNMAKLTFFKLLLLLEILAMTPTTNAFEAAVSSFACRYVDDSCLVELEPNVTVVRTDLFTCTYNARLCRLAPIEKGLVLFVGNAWVTGWTVLSYVLGELVDILSYTYELFATLAMSVVMLVCYQVYFARAVWHGVVTAYNATSGVVLYDSGRTSHQVYQYDPYKESISLSELATVVLVDLAFAYLLNKLLRRARDLVMSPVFSLRQLYARYTEVAKGSVVVQSCKKLIRNATTLEMAVSGSDFEAVRKLNRSMLAFVVQDTESGKPFHVGFAFRYGKYLVTANHVVNELEERMSAVRLAPLKQANGGVVIDLARSWPWELGREANIVGSTADDVDLAAAYDCYMEKITEGEWADKGITSLKKTSPTLGSHVQTVGYVEPALKRASGVIVKGKEPTRIYYTSSTMGGSSGSPVMVSTKLAALHQSTDGQRNCGLSVSVIDAFIRSHEGSVNETMQGVYLDRIRNVYRDQGGREVEIHEEAFGLILVTKRGTRVALMRSEIGDFADIEQHLDEEGYGYRFECNRPPVAAAAPESRVIADHRNGEVTMLPVPPAKIISPRKRTMDRSLVGTSLRVLEKQRKVVRTPTFKGRDPHVVAIVDKIRAKELGYEEGVFRFPEFANMNTAVSTSFEKHAGIQAEAVSNCKVPDDDYRGAAMRAVKDLLASNAYLMQKEPVSDEAIATILNSSRIKESHSPGRQFIEEGHVTNASVLEAYSNRALAEMVRGAGSKPGLINVFAKIEPHKKEKIEKGMPRLISGVGLIDQIECHAYFGAFNEALTANHRNSPIMVGWSPLQPGAGEWFYNEFRGRKRIVEDDLKNWDWSMQDWMIEDVVDVLIALAEPGRLTEEEAAAWRADARQVALKQFLMPFVMPDGTVVERVKPCIMTSGSVLTLGLNSVAMVYLDTLAKLMMGYTVPDVVDRRLRAKFVLKVGGDDKVQAVPKDFDHQAYVSKLTSFGLVVHAVEEHSSMDGVEFFSTRFAKNELGEVTWKPTRFTKHVENLLACSADTLLDTLVSAMYNWVHDREKFDWFRSMALDCAEDLRMIPDRRDLVHKMRGFECARKC